MSWWACTLVQYLASFLYFLAAASAALIAIIIPNYAHGLQALLLLRIYQQSICFMAVSC